MANRFQNGAFCPVSFQALVTAQAPGGPVAALNPATVLGIKGHSLDVEDLMLDVTTTQAGGTRARIAGLEDYNGTINLVLDKDALPWGLLILAKAGVSAICVFYLNPVTGIQVPVITQKTNYTSKVDEAVMHNITVLGNSLAGVIVYPPIL